VKQPDWVRAVTGGDVDAVRRWLASGGDVNTRDRYGQTALMLAAHRGHLPVVEVLVAAGADLDVTAKYHLSALMLAVIAGHGDIAHRLAAAGADRAIEGRGPPGFDGKTAHDLAREHEMDDLAARLRPQP
jgi:ankyrin repeat protein